jgi:hypothetical protein
MIERFVETYIRVFFALGSIANFPLLGKYKPRPSDTLKIFRENHTVQLLA